MEDGAKASESRDARSNAAAADGAAANVGIEKGE